MEAGKIGISVANELAGMKPEEQQMVRKYYKERGDIVDAVQSRRGKGLHLGKKVILILRYIFRNHSNFAH